MLAQGKQFIGISDEETLVYSTLLDNHIGRRKAIKVKHLAFALGFRERELQHLVRSLRMQGARIASTAARPAGYYIPETVEEAEEYKQEQYSKALATLESTAAVLRVNLPDLLGQLRLQVEGTTR
jgi:predicted DNA-binding transcriptional regulator YafY